MLRRFGAPITAAALLIIPVSGFAQTAAWRSPSSTVLSRTADEAQAPYYEARRTAYDQGYREGAGDGQEDARKGDRFDYRDERAFQRADRGYNRTYGDRERYRQTFRDGYSVGYREAFGRFSRNGRNDGWYSQSSTPRGPYGLQGPYTSRGGDYRNGGAYYTPAFDNGGRDGYEKGQEDARKRRSFDPLRHSWYRSGDRHYENRYGSREQYKDVYRQGFQQGYERGFREGRYSW